MYNIIPTGDYVEEVVGYPQAMGYERSFVIYLKRFLCLCTFVMCMPACSPEMETPPDNDNSDTDTQESQINHLPVITSEPVIEALPDNAYLYQANADDEDGDELRWQLLEAPEGIRLDSQSGLLYGMFSHGEHTVTIAVTDGLGAPIEQSFIVHVSTLPVLTSSPPAFAFSGNSFRYQMHAYDPGELELSYSIMQGPTGMDMVAQSGVLTWEDPQVGIFDIQLRVINNLGQSVTQQLQLQILDESGLAIVSRPDPYGYVSLEYEYQLSVLTLLESDPSFSLIRGPPGMTVDESTGQISWVPQIEGHYPVEVQVMNEAGFIDTQRFEISVSTLGSMDMMFNTRIDTLFESVAMGNVHEAAQLLTAQAVVTVLPVLLELQPFLSSIKESFGTASRLMINGDIAEYVIQGLHAGENRTFIVTFIRDSSGTWKIHSL